jgi:hypothetical protein
VEEHWLRLISDEDVKNLDTDTKQVAHPGGAGHKTAKHLQGNQKIRPNPQTRYKKHFDLQMH